jgi:hypothetical protein
MDTLISMFELLIGISPDSVEFYRMYDVSDEARSFVWWMFFIGVIHFIGWSYKKEHNNWFKAFYLSYATLAFYCLCCVLIKLYGVYFVL